MFFSDLFSNVSVYNSRLIRVILCASSNFLGWEKGFKTSWTLVIFSFVQEFKFSYWSDDSAKTIDKMGNCGIVKVRIYQQIICGRRRHDPSLRQTEAGIQGQKQVKDSVCPALRWLCVIKWKYKSGIKQKNIWFYCTLFPTFQFIYAHYNFQFRFLKKSNCSQFILRSTNK